MFTQALDPRPPIYIKLTEFVNQHIAWDTEVAQKLRGSVPLAAFGFSVFSFDDFTGILSGTLALLREWRVGGGFGVTYGWSSA